MFSKAGRSQLSLPHGTQNKNWQTKNLKQKFDMLRRVGEWLGIREVSPVRGNGLRWEGFAKKVGFESQMKDRVGYG